MLRTARLPPLPPQALVKRGTGSQFSFKFFVQSTRWPSPGALGAEVAAGAWLPATAGKELLLKIREREGARPPKALWAEALELAGGAYADVARDLLGED